MLPQDLTITVEVTFRRKKLDSINLNEVKLIWHKTNWHKLLSMTFLFVMPKGIWVEKSSGAGGTAQPHTQMHPAHVSANGCPEGGWSLASPLNLALINPFDALHIQSAMWAGDGYIQGLKDGQGGSLLCQNASLSCESKDLGLTSLGSWGDGLDTVAVGAWWYLFEGGRAVDMGECDRAPLRSLYKPSASNPAIAIFTFWRPSVSKHWASSHNRLAQHNKCSPWKRRVRDLSQRSGLAMK